MNRQKVWLQKRKSLFDESNYNYINANIDANGLIIAGAVNYKLIYIEVEPNTIYKISCDEVKELVINTTNEVPKVGIQGTTRIVATTKDYYITTNSNANYLCLRNDTNNDAQNYLNVNLRIQKEEKIYILNDNNVYEEFMKKEEKKILSKQVSGNTGQYGNIDLGLEVSKYIILEMVARAFSTVSGSVMALRIGSGTTHYAHVITDKNHEIVTNADVNITVYYIEI